MSQCHSLSFSRSPGPWSAILAARAEAVPRDVGHRYDFSPLSPSLDATLAVTQQTQLSENASAQKWQFLVENCTLSVLVFEPSWLFVSETDQLCSYH